MIRRLAGGALLVAFAALVVALPVSAQVSVPTSPPTTKPPTTKPPATSAQPAPTTAASTPAAPTTTAKPKPKTTTTAVPTTTTPEEIPTLPPPPGAGDQPATVTTLSARELNENQARVGPLLPLLSIAGCLIALIMLIAQWFLTRPGRAGRTL